MKRPSKESKGTVVTVQTYREIVVFYAPQSETMDGGAFANGRMDAPLSDKEQKIRLFPMHSTKRPVPVNSNGRFVCFPLALDNVPVLWYY